MPRTWPTASAAGLTGSFLDRLALNDKRVEAMADGIEVVRELADPVGRITESWTRPNGMTHRARARADRRHRHHLREPAQRHRRRRRADAQGRQRRDPARRLRQPPLARAIHAALAKGLREANLPEAAISLVPTRDRAAVGMMLQGLDGSNRRASCRAAARAWSRACRPRRGCRCSRISKASVTSMSTARPRSTWRRSIVLNAKLRRTGVCGAAETLLVDRAAAATHLKPLVAMLLDAGCEVRGDAAVQKADARVKPASEADWSTEYLDAIITAGVVDGVDAAIDSHRALRLASHRRDRHRRSGSRGQVPERGRFGDRAAQRLDPVRRWRRVRLRRRDRHRHRQAACARPGRRRAAHQLQVPRPRHGADPAVRCRDAITLSPCGRGWSEPKAGPGEGFASQDLVPHRTPHPVGAFGARHPLPQGESMPASSPRLVLPPHAPGMRIGLFGGTFDPPHAAHLAASLLAMKRLKLDRVWWLVTPGNPLKDTRRPAAARAAHGRRARARRPSAHRRDRSRSCHQHALHLRHARFLVRRCPGVRFVWIMGADNLRSFHRWQNWRGIAALMPMAVVDRVGPSLYAAGGRPRQALARYRIPERDAASLAEPEPAGLGLPPRPQVAAVLHRAASGAGTPQEVETVAVACLS